jgi:excisionase family DNA binding protein
MEDHDEGRRVMETEVVVKEWLTYQEAQRYAGLGRTKLWELVSSGNVKAARVGSHSRTIWRVRRLSLSSQALTTPPYS